jgi:Asp-tRNA(Asn)/Glu-tRNA(Gln) amidotransferase A subunit family amidase
VVAAPVGTVAEPEGGGASLPVGMQIIAAPWREDVCLRVARALERLGAARFTPAKRTH